jgi:hypothetical protein
VEALAGRLAKNVHGVQKGVDLWHVREEGLNVIGKLGGSEAQASHQHTNATGLEVAEKGDANEEVEEGGERAALANSGSKGVGGRDGAVDQCLGGGGRKEEGSPLEEAFADPKRAHHSEKEDSVDSIVGLVEITKGDDGPAVVGK